MRQTPTAMCIVAPLKYSITSYILYRNRRNYIQRGLQGPWRLQNSLQDYFTAKCDFLILRVRVRFKVGFYSHENQLRRIPYSEQIGWLPIRCTYFILFCLSYGPRCEKTCLPEFANNTGADQPAHPLSLISVFVIRFLESIICKLATDEITIF